MVPDYQAGALNSFNSQISSTDLVNVGSAALANPVVATASGGSGAFPDSRYQPGEINDGTSTSAYFNNGSTATFEFDLDTASAPAGYDITSIASFAGLDDGGYFISADQEFKLLVATVADSTPTQVGTIFRNAPDTDTPNTYGSPGAGGLYVNSTLTTLADGTDPGITPILTGVTKIIMEYDNVNWTQTAVNEIDIEGAPTAAPEPASIGLLSLGCGAFLLRRRKS
jgi:hypothetical protein